MRNGLFIPTTNVALAERCLASFSYSQSCCDTPIYITYMGDNEYIETRKINDKSILIGYEHAEYLSSVFSDLAKYPKKFLFGKPYYNRSFGGASNLILSIASALRIKTIYKCDDDCLENQEISKSWLCAANQLRASAATIYYGKYIETKAILNHIPKQTLSKLITFIYPVEEHNDRLAYKNTINPAAIKNGNIIIPRQAAETACYPVLYSDKLKIHARGEVNYWARHIKRKGFVFQFSNSLTLLHNKLTETSISTWLASLLLAYDLSYLDRKSNEYSPHIPINKRIDKVIVFRDWMKEASWNADVNISSILNNITIEDIISFTDEYFARRNEISVAWKRLMACNKDSVLNILTTY